MSRNSDPAGTGENRQTWLLYCVHKPATSVPCPMICFMLAGGWHLVVGEIFPNLTYPVVNALDWVISMRC